MLANYPAHLCDSGRGNTPGNVSSHGRTGPEKLWDTPSFDLQMNSSLSRSFFKCRLKWIKRHNKGKGHILLSSPVFICPAHQFQFIFFFVCFCGDSGTFSRYYRHLLSIYTSVSFSFTNLVFKLFFFNNKSYFPCSLSLSQQYQQYYLRVVFIFLLLPTFCHVFWRHPLKAFGFRPPRQKKKVHGNQATKEITIIAWLTSET